MSHSGATPEVLVDGQVTVIVLGPAFRMINDHLLESGLADALIRITEEANPPLVVMDLSQTHFFGSSFIEVLFRIWNRLHARAGKFAICGLTPHCLDVLKITHLDTLWPLLATRDEAVNTVAGVAP